MWWELKPCHLVPGSCTCSMVPATSVLTLLSVRWTCRPILWLMLIGLRGRYHYGTFFIIPNWEGDLAFILVPKPWYPRCPLCPQYCPKCPRFPRCRSLSPSLPNEKPDAHEMRNVRRARWTDVWTPKQTHTYTTLTHFPTIHAQGSKFEVSRYFIKYSNSLS